MDSLLLDFDLNFGEVCLDHLSGHPFVYERSLINSSEVKWTVSSLHNTNNLASCTWANSFPFSSFHCTFSSGFLYPLDIPPRLVCNKPFNFPSPSTIATSYARPTTDGASLLHKPVYLELVSINAGNEHSLFYCLSSPIF